MTEISTILRSLLTKYDISETFLANKIDVCQPVIHRILSGETDNPKIKTLIPIAAYFKISVDQLVGTKSSEQNQIQAGAIIPVVTMEQAPTWQQQTGATSIIIEDTGANCFAAIIADSTMAPRFPEGTTIIIDPTRAPSDKDFILTHLKHSKQASFKQLLIDGENKYLKSLNPDFPIQELTKDHVILGTMIEARMH